MTFQFANSPRDRRAAFTLIELLVAMALIILIMSILAEAFSQGANVLREAKAVGDMQESLRTSVVLLRDDLIQRHFDGSKRLSTSFTNYSRPEAGFFRIQQASPGILEGVNSDGIPSYRATNHILHLTVKHGGERRSNYQTADAPPVALNPFGQQPCRHLWSNPEAPSDYRQAGSYLSQWTEVMWFLSPMIDPDTGQQMTAGGGPIPLWTLHRRQRLLIDPTSARALNTIGGPDRISSQFLGRFAQLACKPDPRGGQADFLYFCTPTDAIDPENRSMMDATNGFSLGHPVGTPYPPTHSATLATNPEPEAPGRQGDDRVVSDVISFEIRVFLPGSREFEDVPALPNIYDTADWRINNPAESGGGDRESLTLKGIQIVLRVWDYRTDQTRQVTMMQDL